MKKLTISGQLFYSIIILFLAFAGSFLLYQNHRERLFKIELLNQHLQDYNVHLGEALEYFPLDEDAVEAYIASHPADGLRITLLDTRGYVLFDNKSKEYPNLSDHRERKEIKLAMEHGSGYDIDRRSATLDEEYFYSATFFPEQQLIIRSAVPYDDNLPKQLKADMSFLWFAAAVMLVLICVLIWFVKRTGDSIRKRQTQASDKLQKELTQNISHELKTPLAGIRAYLETLDRDPDIEAETRHKFISRSLALTNRLSLLVEDLGELEKMETPDSFTTERLDISRIIHQIVQETEVICQEKNISVSLDIPEVMPYDGNNSLIYSIFRNLIDNSLKYCPDGSEIAIAGHRSGGKWKFSYSDNGPGVPQESIARLFDRFYRVDKGRSRELGGTGLGLPIVKHAVMAHGGTIRAMANVPQGLKYEFDL